MRQNGGTHLQDFPSIDQSLSIRFYIRLPGDGILEIDDLLVKRDGQLDLELARAYRPPQ